MQDGDKLLLRGSGGAMFRVTVGQPFTKELIERRVKAGEWSWPDTGPKPVNAKADKPAPIPEAPKGEPQEAKPADPDRPTANAPKSEWVQYAARTQHMSLEDAANYTKADLIDLTS